MFNTPRTARCFSHIGWFALAGLLLVAAPSRAASPPEKVLPDSTVAFIKFQNSAALREAFPKSQLGQLWSDPAFDAFRLDLGERWDELSKALKEKLGVTYSELFEWSQGPVAFAALKNDDAQVPLSLVAVADAGNNAAAVNELLSRLTRRGEQIGAKVATEMFQGVMIHVIRPGEDEPIEERDKGENADADEDDEWDPLIAWSSQGSTFYLGSDVETIKDLIAHAEGRDHALAASETYDAAVKKVGCDAPVFWFVDLSQVGLLMARDADLKALPDIKGFAQGMGLGNLKAITGSFAPSAGNCEGINKTMLLLQGPAQGLLKVFRLPSIALEPEPWVPAGVATYQSLSWDLDAAFLAISELVNQFQPGLLEILEQQLVGPEGGEPLKFKQDIFDPLGDRITIISDFKKPVTKDTRRMRVALNVQTDDPKKGGQPRIGVSWKEGDTRLLLAVALEDSRAFQNTLNKFIVLTGLQPRKREFQGTTIHDFDLPDADPSFPPAEGARTPSLHLGSLSVAIAKDTLFIAREPTLLEQILRGGGPALAESEEYRTFARELPERLSALCYIRPELQARILYDLMVKGELGTPLLNMAVVGAGDSGLSRLVEAGKVPEFSVFTKYPAQSGIFSEATEDGLTITGFSLRKPQPDQGGGALRR